MGCETLPAGEETDLPDREGYMKRMGVRVWVGLYHRLESTWSKGASGSPGLILADMSITSSPQAGLSLEVSETSGQG